MTTGKAKAKTDVMKREREENYSLIKGRISNEEMTVVNMHAPNGMAIRFLKKKQLVLKENMDGKIILIGDLNLSISDLDQSNQRINNKN